MALGRISGPLLKANLIRDGVDLAFETDLLYLDVTNARIGINRVSPQADLHVNGTVRTDTLVVDNQIDVGNIRLTGNTISSSLTTLNLVPAGADPVVYNSRLQIDDFEIKDNVISTTVSNSNIELRPNGTGIVDIYADTDIDGNLSVTGNVLVDGDVTIGGDIIIGDALTDEIVFNASIKSDLIPETDDNFDLGSPSFRWQTVYANNFYTTTVNLPSLVLGDITIQNNEIVTSTGNDLYLDGNGTGGVRFANFLIVDNVITNVAVNAITQITQTGTGYFKIADNNGFVPPRGTNAERPTAYAVLGMTRYNTESRALEVWDGSAWSSPAGASGAVSEIVANDIAASFALILG